MGHWHGINSFEVQCSKFWHILHMEYELFNEVIEHAVFGNCHSDLAASTFSREEFPIAIEDDTMLLRTCDTTYRTQTIGACIVNLVMRIKW